jgi:hypothetical protein
MSGTYPQPQGVGYHPDFGQEVNYSVESLPESPDGQVRKTMKRVLEYVRTDSDDPYVQHQTEQARRLGGGDPIRGVWALLKGTLKFRQDLDIADDLRIDDPRKEDFIEVLIRPADQARLILLKGMGVEDCDGFNMYGCTLLWAMGVPCSLVTIEADDERPGLFSHVYTAAYPNGYGRPPRIALDFSHGEHIGWEIPDADRRRRREWKCELTFAEQLWDAIFPVGLLVGGYWGVRYLNERSAA